MPETRDLLTSVQHSPEAFGEWIELARAIRAGDHRPEFAGRVGALLFFQASLRTRLSLESALARFGGAAVALTPGSDTWRFAHAEGAVMDGPEQEHVRELAPVVSRMAHFAGVRRADRIGGAGGHASYPELREDTFLRAFAEHATVPVLNLESNLWHPLQGLADRMAVADLAAEPRGQRFVLTWAWHPHALPVATPHSQLLAACDLGLDVVVLRPDGYDLDPEVTAQAALRAESQGGSYAVTDDPGRALRGARFVCAKSWGRLDRYGDSEREAREKQPLREAWCFDRAKLELTDQARFLHCLPVRRNVVVGDDVLNGPASLVVDQAECRLWTAAAAVEMALRA